MKTITKKNKKYHSINDAWIECSGEGCIFCEGDTDISFKAWENSIPFPIPPRGKKYVRPSFQKNRGKTIEEICYTCKEIPCYICKRTNCKDWMKEEHRKGQEKGCKFWENNRCIEFSCEKGLIKTHWRNFNGKKKNN